MGLVESARKAFGLTETEAQIVEELYKVWPNAVPARILSERVPTVNCINPRNVDGFRKHITQIRRKTPRYSIASISGRHGGGYRLSPDFHLLLLELTICP